MSPFTVTSFLKVLHVPALFSVHCYTHSTMAQGLDTIRYTNKSPETLQWRS